MSEELSKMYRIRAENRRNKLDISSGFTDLKAQSTDTYVREFIDKLKTSRESTITSSNDTAKGIEEEK